MHKLLHKGDVLLVDAISTPFRVGVYQEGKLIACIESEGKISDSLTSVLEPLFEKFAISAMAYTSEPGSFLSIKLAYVTLSTLSMLKAIPLYGCSYFDINQNQPVKAMGKLYFLKEKETIITKKFDTPPTVGVYPLPKELCAIRLTEANTPNYRISAV